MKIFIALLPLIAVALAAHETHDDYVIKTHKDLIGFRDECVSKLSIPDDMVAKFKNWQYPDEEKSRCYLKCIFEKFGLYDEKSGFDAHKIHHQLAGDSVDHSDALHGKIEGCIKASTDESDQCTKVYKGATCFFKENLRLVKQSVES